ncbi:MAG TPA: PLP-dependent transferase, partial [Patescibacteria group bacterium]|nr:PLP-dependent transferase [Patescibacteria group bacterium]
MEKEPKMETKITKSHTPDSLDEEFTKFKEGRDDLNVYARYSYREGRELEEKLAKKMGGADAAIFNSGMGAISSSIEAEQLSCGDTVLCSQDVYFLTHGLYDDLKKRGIKIRLFDPGDQEKLVQQIKTLNPRVIIFETVANEKQMNMVDTEKVLQATEDLNKRQLERSEKDLAEIKLAEKKFRDKYANLSDSDIDEFLDALANYQETNNYFCFRKIIKRISSELALNRREVIEDMAEVAQFVTKGKEKTSLIVDNTLPSPELYKPLEHMKQGMLTDMVVVESGTKHYQLGQDEITLGIACSNNPEKIKEIRNVRSKMGNYLQPMNLVAMPEGSIEGMSDKMKRHAQNALTLAESLSELEGIKKVYHPNLKNHPEKDLADKFSSVGIVSLF